MVSNKQIQNSIPRPKRRKTPTGGSKMASITSTKVAVPMSLLFFFLVEFAGIVNVSDYRSGQF